MVQNSFVTETNRDAWYAIRGFVFQVERTIQRWFLLKPGQMIELECGEDLSIISQGLTNETQFEKRILEQVKSRSTQKITLRNGLESLANFVEIRRLNDNSVSWRDLYFCYSTNAEVTIESPHVTNSQRPGIELWSDVVSGQLEPGTQTAVLSALKAFLLGCKKPPKLDATKWENFREFLSSSKDDEWLEFVRRFEWSTGLTAPIELSQKNQQQLILLGLAQTKDEARAQYERLFAHVFLLLSQPERKQLKAEEWRQIAQIETSNEIRSIYRLVTFVEELANRRQLSDVYAGYEVAVRIGQIISEHHTFVGREKELEYLDKFLDEKSSGSLLITAGAGWGKTALLANWLLHRHNEDTYLAYHFFSTKNEITRSLTQCYRHLLIQVLNYYGLDQEVIPDDSETARDVLCGLLQEKGALSGKPLIILLDGLDEAEEVVSPFPISWPDGVYIITSARAEAHECPGFLEDWLKTSQRLSLYRISDIAVSTYLKDAHEGALSEICQDENFLRQVAEITQGFPLHLRFLADELVQALNQEHDPLLILAQTPKGFQAYVTQAFRQLANLEEVRNSRELRKMFALLSVVYGPLSEAEVEQLTDLTSWDMSALPWQVTRWLDINSTDEGLFYSFSHPLLAREFANILRKESQSARLTLTDYCRDWLKHRSPYALRNLPNHLEELELYDELFALVLGSSFREAQLDVVLDDPELPMRTTRATLRYAVDLQRPEIVADLLLSYERQIIDAQRQSPLEELRRGHLYRAWKLADLTDVERRVVWYLLLMWELSDAGQLSDAKATLERLWDNCSSLEQWSWQSSYALFLLPKIVQIDPPTVAILGIILLDSYDHKELAVHISEVGESSMGLATALLQKDGSRQIETLCEIGKSAMSRSDVAFARAAFLCAITLADKHDDKTIRSKYLTNITQAQASCGIVDDSLGTLGRITSWYDYLDALNDVVPALVRDERSEEAQQLVEKANQGIQEFAVVGDDEYFWSSLAQLQGHIGNWVEAELTLNKAPNSYCREKSVMKISECLAQVGLFNEAFRFHSQIEEPSNAIENLRILARVQCAANLHTEAQQTLKKAAVLASELEDDGDNIDRASQMQEVALVQAQLGFFEDALDTTEDIPPTHTDDFKQDTLRRIAVIQAELGEFRSAYSTFKSLSEGASWALEGIAQAHATLGKFDTALTLSHMALRSFHHNGARAFLHLAKHQSNAKKEIEARNSLSFPLMKSERRSFYALQKLCKSHLAIVEVLIKQNLPIQARRLLSNAAVVASTVRSSPNLILDPLLREIAGLQANLGFYDDALHTASRIDLDNWRGESAKSIMRIRDLSASLLAQPSSEEVSSALEWELEDIKRLFSYKKGEGLEYDDLISREENIDFARELKGEERIRKLCNIAIHWGAQDPIFSNSILDEALSAAHLIDSDDKYDRQKAFDEVIHAQARLGHVQDAINLSLKAPTHTDALIAVAKGLQDAGDLESSLEIVQTISDKEKLAIQICHIVHLLVNSGNAARALELVQNLSEDVDNSWRSAALTSLALAQVKVGMGQQAVEIVTRLPNSSQRRDSQHSHLIKLASALSECGDSTNFNRLLMQCADLGDIAYAFSSFLPRLYPESAGKIGEVVMRYAEQDRKQYSQWN